MAGTFDKIMADFKKINSKNKKDKNFTKYIAPLEKQLSDIHGTIKSYKENIYRLKDTFENIDKKYNEASCEYENLSNEVASSCKELGSKRDELLNYSENVLRNYTLPDERGIYFLVPCLFKDNFFKLISDARDPEEDDTKLENLKKLIGTNVDDYMVDSSEESIIKAVSKYFKGAKKYQIDKYIARAKEEYKEVAAKVKSDLNSLKEEVEKFCSAEKGKNILEGNAKAEKLKKSVDSAQMEWERSSERLEYELKQFEKYLTTVNKVGYKGVIDSCNEYLKTNDKPVLPLAKAKNKLANDIIKYSSKRAVDPSLEEAKKDLEADKKAFKKLEKLGKKIGMTRGSLQLILKN